MANWKEDDVTRNDLVRLLDNMQKFAKIHMSALEEQKKGWQTQLDRVKEQEDKDATNIS
tara:strand:- start:742 stop:918 length:177 start_codon:yes stop_codon:yes gene_type:complete